MGEFRAQALPSTRMPPPVSPTEVEGAKPASWAAVMLLQFWM
jgi:hypothetical protein